MAQARTDYPEGQTVCGLMVELTSALVSMTQIQRTVTPDDIDHAREHVMAGLDLAKRLLREQLGPERESPAPSHRAPRHIARVTVASSSAEADALRADLIHALREVTDAALVTARELGVPLTVDVDPDLVIPADGSR